MRLLSVAATAFMLAAPACFAAVDNYTVYSFKGGTADGRNPQAGLVVGKNGAFYGTTGYGGNAFCNEGCGTVFEITPPGSPDKAWIETVLYNFTGQQGDGAAPFAALAVGKDGALFGTTLLGGNSCATPDGTCGTVFELTMAGPSSGAAGAWTETVLYRFTGQNGDGGNPFASLVVGPGGALYGTTEYGGTLGGGTVFELAPPQVPGGAWTETVLHSFGGQSGDGLFPLDRLAVGPDGTLFGTASDGGASGSGIVFQLTPPKTGGLRTETILYNFTGGSDGGYPQGGVVVGNNGEIFGTTKVGGSACSGSGCGTVYQLTPPASPATSWSETVLYNFTGLADGAYPVAGVVIGQGGVLYGISVGGGGTAQYYGSVFKLTPPTVPGGTWGYLNLHSFNDQNGDGGLPFGLIVRSTSQLPEALFGTTDFGGYGSCSCGTVFAISE